MGGLVHSDKQRGIVSVVTYRVRKVLPNVKLPTLYRVTHIKIKGIKTHSIW